MVFAWNQRKTWRLAQHAKAAPRQRWLARPLAPRPTAQTGFQRQYLFQQKNVLLRGND
jgi:hypothetical protein